MTPVRKQFRYVVRSSGAAPTPKRPPRGADDIEARLHIDVLQRRYEVGGICYRSTVGATELSESRVISPHPTWLNEAECAWSDAVLSLSHPGGRRFESG
jgi:hypothetical protein